MPFDLHGPIRTFLKATPTSQAGPAGLQAGTGLQRTGSRADRQPVRATAVAPPTERTRRRGESIPARAQVAAGRAPSGNWATGPGTQLSDTGADPAPDRTIARTDPGIPGRPACRRGACGRANANLPGTRRPGGRGLRLRAAARGNPEKPRPCSFAGCTHQACESPVGQQARIRRAASMQSSSSATRAMRTNPTPGFWPPTSRER